MKLHLHKRKLNEAGVAHFMAFVAVLFIGVFAFTGYRILKSSHAATVTFGTTTPSTIPENLNANYKIGSLYSPTSAGTVTSMSVYLDGKATTSGSGTVRAAIYADSSGTPGVLLGYSAVKTITTGQAAGWSTFTFGNTVPVTAGAKYWLAVTAGDRTVTRVYHSSTASGQVWAVNAGGTVPTAAFGKATAEAGPLAIYATYTPTATTSPVTGGTTTTGTGTTTSNSPSGQVIPADAPAGWSRAFSDDFTTDIAAGQFPKAVSTRWATYNGFADSSKNGMYNNNILSVSGGTMNMHLHTENGKPQVSALAPLINGKWGGMAYGRYSVRFKIDTGLTGYAAAWLLWPDSNTWSEGEMDFPEGAFAGNINGFNHCIGNPKSNCSYALTKTPFSGAWHTTTIEWKPGSLTYILDGTPVMTTNTSVPSTKMHWVLQTETAYGKIPAATTAGNVTIDWVTIDKAL